MHTIQRASRAGLFQYGQKSKTSPLTPCLPSLSRAHGFIISSKPRSPSYHRAATAPLPFLASSWQAQRFRHARYQSFHLKISSHIIPSIRSGARTIVSGNLSSPITHVSEPSTISIERFHRLSDTYIDILVAKFEALQEEREEIDVEYSAGVLNLVFPPVGTYVLNKQPPNKQIWLSSPVSGPKRYDWVEPETDGQKGKWIYLRDGSSLDRLIEEEIGIDLEDD